jgi:hypothetical protein
MLNHVSSGANAIPNSVVNNRNVVQTTDSSFFDFDQSFSTESLGEKMRLQKEHLKWPIK